MRAGASGRVWQDAVNSAAPSQRDPGRFRTRRGGASRAGIPQRSASRAPLERGNGYRFGMARAAWGSRGVVRTDRLVVRPMALDDRREFVRLHAASESAFRSCQPARAPDESWEAVFEFHHASSLLGSVDGRRQSWVGERDDGRIVGIFSLFDIVRGALNAGVASWYVDVGLHRQGYGGEGVNALLDLAFAAPPGGWGLHRVQANIRPENTASLALAGRLGFRVEGLARRYLFIDGDWRDHLLCAKLAEEHRLRWL